MLCSECYKRISQGEEIKIKGSIFCKGCVENNKLIKKEVVTKCHTCPKLIYSDERVYENSTSRDHGLSFGLNIIDSESEKLIKCRRCYKNSLNKKETERKGGKWKGLALIFLCEFFLISLLFLLYPEFKKTFEKNFDSSHGIIKSFGIISTGGITIILLGGTISKFVNNYKSGKKDKINKVS